MKPCIQASLALLLICISLTGCISGSIVGSGKRYEHLLKKETTVHDVRKTLGNPDWSRRFTQPIPISETEELKSYIQNSQYHHPPFIWGEEEVATDELSAFCEVYKRKGPYEDISRGQAHAMVGALTLGVGDVLLLPSAVNERTRMNKKHYSLTFWYDADGHYVGYYYGDIREVEPRHQFNSQQNGGIND